MAQANPVNSGPLIRCLDCTKRFPQGGGVKHVTLDVARGELFVVSGATGSGKTTLLRLIAGLLPIASGDVLIEGRPIAHPLTPITPFTSYMAQEHDTPDYLSPLELLLMTGNLRGMPSGEARAAARDLLDRSRLTSVARRPLRSLTDAQHRLTRFCAAMMGYPRLLILDDPAHGLDLRQRKWLWEILQQLHQQTGITTVLTTQHLGEIDHLASRVAFLREGEMVALGAPAVLKKQFSSGPRMDIRLISGAKINTQARGKLKMLGTLIEREAEVLVLYPKEDVIGSLGGSIPIPVATPAPVKAARARAAANTATNTVSAPVRGPSDDSWLLDRTTQLPGSLGRTVEEIFTIIGAPQIAEFWFSPPSLEDVALYFDGEAQP